MGDETPTATPPPSGVQAETTDDEITGTPADGLTQIALDLLAVLPSLL